jgi:hypothetical protein
MDEGEGGEEGRMSGGGGEEEEEGRRRREGMMWVREWGITRADGGEGK